MQTPRQTTRPEPDLGRIQVEISDLSRRVDAMGCTTAAYFLLCAQIAMNREMRRTGSGSKPGGPRGEDAP